MLKKLIGLLLVLPSLAFAADFVEGKDYQVVASASIEHKTPLVTEFFSYGCPWCYRLEAPMDQWVGTLNKATTVERVPVVFKPDWELYAKAYYTAKTLALSNKLTPQLFKAIQNDKKPLNSKPAMISFFTAHGVDKEIATSAFDNSPTIDMRVKNGMTLMARYQINAVPAFVINNKYKTDLQMAGSPERLFEIMNYLLKK
jgi:protein dithiol oxidoreductase (disulfide-forming)